MFLLWANFGVTMIVCWIKIYAVFLAGGVDVGRVVPEVVVSVFADAGGDLAVGATIQATMVPRLVKYRHRYMRMCHR
jgi:hypothetical protein